jgi:hypothetical protein
LPAAPAAADGTLAGVPAAAIVAPRGAPAAERFVPRDPEEWQGMLVRDDERPTCIATEHCGLATTCLSDGTCGACRRDDDCLAGEGCVLDHCLKRDQMACRSRRDCDQSAGRTLCVLTGFSDDPRGNAAMRSECMNEEGGRPQAPPPAPPEPGAPPPTPSMEQRLLESLQHES